MSVLLESLNGTAEEKTNQIIDKLTSVSWFHQAGVQVVETEDQMVKFLDMLDVKEYEIKWASKEEVPALIGQLSFSGSKLWEELRELPDQLKEKIDANNQNNLLETLVDRLPEAVFHPAFEGAYQQFNDKKTINYLITLSMYLGLMTTVAELSGEDKLFKPITEMIESGHAPLGLKANVIYLI